MNQVLSTSLAINEQVQSLQISSHTDKITKWLSAPDPSTNLNKARELHQAGTGQWLLESEKYRTWKANPGSFLWLYGIPGCGKTILSSTVVVDLDDDPTTSLNVLYFYFNFTDVEKRSTENAVRSLIDQLYRKKVETQEVVNTLYTAHEKGRRQPTHSSLQDTLQIMISKCHNIWLILDGLDECETRDQHIVDGILPWIKHLKHTSPNSHLLVTSRPEQDIKAAIEAWAGAKEVIPLQSNLVSNDIEAYILAKVERMERWRTRPGIQKSITAVLQDRADGM